MGKEVAEIRKPVWPADHKLLVLRGVLDKLHTSHVEAIVFRSDRESYSDVFI